MRKTMIMGAALGAVVLAAGGASAADGDWQMVQAKYAEDGPHRAVLAVDAGSLRRDGTAGHALVAMLMDPPDATHAPALQGLEMDMDFDCAAGTLRVNAIAGITADGVGALSPMPADVAKWSPPEPYSPITVVMAMACQGIKPGMPAYAGPNDVRAAWLKGG